MAKKHKAANDNQPRRYLVGAGNITWVKPEVPNMTAAEVFTLARPLAKLNDLIRESVDTIRNLNGYAAIYAISDIYGEATKIGKAGDPIARLAQLQTGNHRKLFLHRVFWLAEGSRPIAEETDVVERDAHVRAGSLYTRLEGEWFRCSPSEAHKAIEEVVTVEKGTGRIAQYCVMTPEQELWRAAA
jgi:hypothetical protein